MKYSPELLILIESIKVSLLEKDSHQLSNLLRNGNIDWQRLKKMVAYHAIRPVVYDALVKIKFNNDFVEYLRRFCLEQTVMNLKNANELSLIIKLLRKYNIRVSPYKGILFLEKLYEGRQLREIGDLDLLLHPSDAKKALKILHKEGYNWSEDIRVSTFKDRDIDAVLNYSAEEVGLDKDMIHIDFHWGIAEQYRDISFDYAQIFEGDDFTVDKILMMTLIHHGGRDCWLRLKCVVDFMMLLQKFQNNINWEFTNKRLKEYKLFRSKQTGLFLVELFSEQKTKLSDAPSELIIKYWERAEIWQRLKNKLLYHQIYFSLQDDSFSKRTYLKEYLKVHSYPNPIEKERIVTFPNNWPLLNLISKILSILIRKVTS